jgi:hypothetical protein
VRSDFRAVLAAMFLKEELGPLGRIGCAICLIGSVIIVLHAPPDTEIETVDEILNYALQPGILVLNKTNVRLSILLHICRSICISHDIPSCAHLRKEKSSHIHLDMLHGRFSLGHVDKGFWYRLKAHLCRIKSV